MYALNYIFFNSMCRSSASSIIVFGDSVSKEAMERSLVGGVLIQHGFYKDDKAVLIFNEAAGWMYI